MVKDKEITTVLSLLPANAHYYFTKAQIPRALPESELEAKATEFDLKGHSYPTVSKAIQKAIDSAHRNDMILVCGSVFVVGEVESDRLKW